MMDDTAMVSAMLTILLFTSRFIDDSVQLLARKSKCFLKEAQNPKFFFAL
jgi:hypothetical protein